MIQQTPEKPAVSKPKARERLKGPKLQDASRSARQVATAILEVMAGARLPSDAAKALGVSQPRYYLLESRAMNGLIAACEPRRMGRVRSAESELANARRTIQRLEQDCARYAALARVAQRTVGLNAPQPPKPEPGKKPRKRKPTVRALKVLNMLKSQPSGEEEAGSAGEQPAKE
jgi:hypothetical protein